MGGGGGGQDRSMSVRLVFVKLLRCEIMSDCQASHFNYRCSGPGLSLGLSLGLSFHKFTTTGGEGTLVFILSDAGLQEQQFLRLIREHCSRRL